MTSLQTMLSPPQETPHPSRMRWDLYVLQQISVQEQTVLERHLHTCSRCRQTVRTLQQEREQFQQQRDVVRFEQAVSAGMARSQDPATSKDLGLWDGWRRWWQPTLWVSACGGVAVLAFFFLQSVFVGQPSTGSSTSLSCDMEAGPESGIRRKGSPELAVYRFRNGLRTLARSGSVFSAGDMLALRYRASGYSYLTVVYVDAKGRMDWLYPQKPGTSLSIAAQGDLQDSIILDNAKGTESLLAFFSSHPLQANHLDALIKRPLRSGHLRLSCSTPHVLFLQKFVLQKP